MSSLVGLSLLEKKYGKYFSLKSWILGKTKLLHGNHYIDDEQLAALLYLRPTSFPSLLYYSRSYNDHELETNTCTVFFAFVGSHRENHSA